MVSGGLAVTALAGCGGSDGGTEQSAQTEVSEGIKTAAEDNKVTTFALPDGPEESEIYVEPIADLLDDFIRGMDASAVLSLENSGVTYYNYEGKEQDVFETLAQSGVNYIRLRVWNDPYDADGNGYGGGNNDVATAVALGKRATAYGMKVCVDFHYSDFWADPKRQHAPKAWEGMSASEKSEALYDFTKESLAELLDAGVDVGMVQVGNEINNGMAGEEDVDTVMDLIASGSRAVREIADEYEKTSRLPFITRTLMTVRKWIPWQPICRMPAWITICSVCPIILTGTAPWKICRQLRKILRTPTEKMSISQRRPTAIRQRTATALRTALPARRIWWTDMRRRCRARRR